MSDIPAGLTPEQWNYYQALKSQRAAGSPLSGPDAEYLAQIEQYLQATQPAASPQASSSPYGGPVATSVAVGSYTGSPQYGSPAPQTSSVPMSSPGGGSPYQADAVASRPLVFADGATGWFGVYVGGFFVAMLTLGLLTPLWVVWQVRWIADNTTVNGRRVAFTGSAMDLFGKWIVWWLLTLITLGIYSIWLYPKVYAWIVANLRWA